MANLKRSPLSFTLSRIAAIAIVLLATGCERTARNMYDQPRYKPLAQSALWPDGRASRPPPPGAVAHAEGTSAGTSSGRLGVLAQGRDSSALPAGRQTWTFAVLERGRERYDIFCAPCHGEAGDGDGTVVRRGFPRPPSFHDDRLRQASDAHFYAAITEGYGAMYPYAGRISSDDRQAIVGYVRALQLSQNARLADVPSAWQARLAHSP
jgi:cytochrome c553